MARGAALMTAPGPAPSSSRPQRRAGRAGDRSRYPGPARGRRPRAADVPLHGDHERPAGLDRGPAPWSTRPSWPCAKATSTISSSATRSGAVAGIVRNRDLLLFHRYSLAVLTQEIRHAGLPRPSPPRAAACPGWSRSLVEGGAKARNITRAVTAVTDAAVDRLIELAVADLGPPPARFAFLALGSEGREEQTLATDQDHAIVFEDVPGARSRPSRPISWSSGRRRLRTGWPWPATPSASADDHGLEPRVGASPSRTWQRLLRRLARGRPSPRTSWTLKIFFDFRTVHGEPEFAPASSAGIIDEVLAQEPPFLLHYAQYTLQYKAP
ncbi:MAG: DUF294 nucleotidyltransferase-like domain-containing protein [Comamonadaceae bacterium]|nr:DUF294 nucleotidyltransferase-like domain-containing protein [Comamonadaceae bacterium]